MRVIAAIFVTALLCACTSDVLLKKGDDVVTCKGGCASGGLAGIPCRNTQRACVDDFKQAGYARIQ
jgi:hypothetical protein